MKDGSDEIYILNEPLIYRSDYLKRFIVVPAEFNTDLASVPRVPFIFLLWGGRAHREAIIHDLLFRIDSVPNVSFFAANWVFLEAMKSRGKPYYIRHPMYAGVCIGAYPHYHKKGVADKL